jgi:DNA-binding transcriptional regulator LsrR (DeoR family)
MADKKSALIRKMLTTQSAVKKCEAMTKVAQKTHRAALLAAVESGVAQREVARQVGVSEVTLREKLQRARTERA